MIPQQVHVLGEIVRREKPSLTYYMDRETDKIVNTCSDLEAVQQSVYKILNTERYDCPIYSWNYGVELKDLIGKPVNYCMAELERRITEALRQDDRVRDVYGFTFDEAKKGKIHMFFTVETTKGTFTTEQEVSV